LLPREKNPKPNPRIQKLYKCFEPKSSALGGYLSLLITTGSCAEASQTRELPVPEINQNWRIAGSSTLKTLKTTGFHERTGKGPAFFWVVI
jgi:hypothetical protein